MPAPAFTTSAAGQDHLAPGTGEADFAAILRHLPADATKILEIRPSVPREELLAASDMLRSLGYCGPRNGTWGVSLPWGKGTSGQ